MFYARVVTTRRLIARGANPGQFEDEVRVAALGKLGEIGDTCWQCAKPSGHSGLLATTATPT